MNRLPPANGQQGFIVHFVSYTGPRDRNAQNNPAVQILGRSKLQTSVPFMEESLIYKAQVSLGSDFKTASALGAGSQSSREEGASANQ